MRGRAAMEKSSKKQRGGRGKRERGDREEGRDMKVGRGDRPAYPG